MNIKEALSLAITHNDLDSQQMADVMRQIMTGEVSSSMICAFTVALRMKGESVDEVAAAAKVMRELSSGVTLKQTGAVDIVGTGGDATSTFNVSTASALVAAAAGVRIAKHGSRSVSSKSGAADLLEAAGVNIDLSPQQISECVDQVGVGFMFAPHHHSAMKHAVGPRTEMGVRTIFNLLGPLTNPAAAPNQVMGVFDAAWVRPMAEVLSQLGSHHVLVVNGEDGMDEITCTGPTRVAELQDGQIKEYTIEPQDFSLSVSAIDSIKVQGAEQSYAMISDVFAGKAGAARDIVSLNAGATIYVGGLAANLGEGVERAIEVIDNGSARSVLDKLVRFTQAQAKS